MPKAFPAELHRDVVAVARNREAPISQVAKDFGISETTLHAWLKKDNIEEGVRPGLTDADAKELREYTNRVRLLEPETDSRPLSPVTQSTISRIEIRRLSPRRARRRALGLGLGLTELPSVCGRSDPSSRDRSRVRKHARG